MFSYKEDSTIFQRQEMREPFTFFPDSYIFATFHAVSVSKMETVGGPQQSRLMASPGAEVWLSEMILLTLRIEIELKSQFFILKKINSIYEGEGKHFSSRFFFPPWSYWIFIFCILSCSQIKDKKQTKRISWSFFQAGSFWNKLSIE